MINFKNKALKPFSLKNHPNNLKNRKIMIKNKYKMLLMFALSSFLTPFVGSSMNLALPIIGKDFGMNIISLGWIATIFLLSTSIFLVPFGRLADILGRKKIFITGIITFTLASILCGLSNSGTFLLIARAIQGIGSAMIFGTSMALLVSIFPPRERGQALGFNVSGAQMGNSVGPIIGGFVTQYLGWRYIFAISTIFGAIVIYLGLKYIDGEHANSKGEKFDIIGSILYAISVISILYAPSILPSLTGFAIIAIGISVFTIFSLYEKKIKHPVFDIDLLLKNKKFAMSSLAALLNFSAAFAVPFLISMYLQYARGFQPNEAGIILLFLAITMAICAPIAGRLSDLKDKQIIAATGMSIAATAILTLSFILTQNTPISAIAILLAIFGFGLSLFSTPNTHAAMDSVSHKHLGLASSVLGTMRMLGQALSMSTTMLIFSLIIGKVKISSSVLPQLMQSIHIILFIFGVLCILGALASLVRGTKDKEIIEKI
jgi:EmrB/QacA subfamily drug resistance transporter